MTKLAATIGVLLLASFGMAGCASPACADNQQSPCVCTEREGKPTGLQVCAGGKYGECDCSAMEAQWKADADEAQRVEDQVDAERVKLLADIAEFDKKRAEQDAEMKALNKKLRETRSDADREPLLLKKQDLEAQIAELTSK